MSADDTKDAGVGDAIGGCLLLCVGAFVSLAVPLGLLWIVVRAARAAWGN